MCPGLPSSQAILPKSVEVFMMGKMGYNWTLRIYQSISQHHHTRHIITAVFISNRLYWRT